MNLLRTKSIKINAIFNALYQILSMLVPLITAPYISRVLGPDNNGIYSYYYSIVTYFVLVATFGFADYGTKAIAEVRDSFEERSKVFFSILTSKLILGFLTLIGFFIFTFASFNGDVNSFYIFLALSSFIFAAILDPTFYFQGQERFVSISIRNILIRILTTVLIFLLVKNENDLLIYSIIMGLGQLMATLVMYLSFGKKEIKFIKVNLKNDIWPSLKNSFEYFLPALAVTLFYSLNQTLLGLFGYEDAESGYFGQASKIIQILQTLAGSLSIISLSRMSYLFSKQDLGEIQIKIKKIFSAFWPCVLPLVFGICAISFVFVPAFLGQEYEKSIYLVIIMSPVILFSPLNTLIGNIYFRPMNQLKKQTAIIFVASVINVIVCCCLIPFYQSIGSSIGRTIAEVFQLPLLIYFSYKFINYKDVFKSAIKPLISSLFMFVFVFVFMRFVDINEWVEIFLGIGIGAISYFLIEILLKDEFITSTTKQLLLFSKKILCKNHKKVKKE